VPMTFGEMPGAAVPVALIEKSADVVGALLKATRAYSAALAPPEMQSGEPDTLGATCPTASESVATHPCGVETVVEVDVLSAPVGPSLQAAASAHVAASQARIEREDGMIALY